MDNPSVFITRKVPEDTIAPLREVADVKMWDYEDTPVPRDILLEEAETATALYTILSDGIDRELFERAKHLKVVGNLAVGYDNVDVGAATEHGVVVCNTPDVLTDTTADLAFALLMAAARRIPEAEQYIKEGKWGNWSPLLLAGQDIHHKTLGIVGMGRIGESVAKRATGFEMEILYHNRSRNEKAEKELGATYALFDEILERADFVLNLTPLTSETKGMFNRNVFSKMKKNAIFLNVGRGGAVVEEDLVAAIKQGDIAGAGLDVFQKEPIPEDHPLVQLPNVVCLPHIGSASVETRKAMCSLTARNIRNVLSGERPEAAVNWDEIK
ncbi:D-glycerate dehydrogenase [Alkalihalobacillus sp. TS-13]|uniref:2-hydroxyacid dehydrogenase n=1 Tax=Alkalihalobacillus sp. TS-13 TaxID=2842455 RepID=UPI001C86EDAA|nr:D-glycerate dehydrogenase [Alkalihalobacillus sp. TS-13]